MAGTGQPDGAAPGTCASQCGCKEETAGWSGCVPAWGGEKTKQPRYAFQITRFHSVLRWSGQPLQSPVGLNDFLSISQGSFPVLHVQADAHGLVHHVQHVHVTVLKHGAHLLLAELANLQQLARGCSGVKEMTGLLTWLGDFPRQAGFKELFHALHPRNSHAEEVNYRKPSKSERNHIFS